MGHPFRRTETPMRTSRPRLPVIDPQQNIPVHHCQVSPITTCGDARQMEIFSQESNDVPKLAPAAETDTGMLRQPPLLSPVGA